MLTLRIKNPSLKDAGLYRCNAFNESGDSNANIDLKFESKSIQNFNKVRFRKDKVIKNDSRITSECKKGKKNRFMLTLRIKNPSLKDAGLYRCNAFNESGDSNANIDLKFESKSIQKKSFLFVLHLVLGSLFHKDVFLIKSRLMIPVPLIK